MLELVDACAILRVQSWDNTGHAAPPEAAESALAILWPRKVGTQAVGTLEASSGMDSRPGVEVLCIGPTDWLLLAEGSLASALLQRLSAAFAGTSFRATDLSSALGRIGVRGVGARTLLGKGASLDLSPQGFPAGCCARTRLAGLPVVVRCVEVSAFECIVTRSYREYLSEWLSDAAQEFAVAQ